MSEPNLTKKAKLNTNNDPKKALHSNHNSNVNDPVNLVKHNNTKKNKGLNSEKKALEFFWRSAFKSPEEAISYGFDGETNYQKALDNSLVNFLMKVNAGSEKIKDEELNDTIYECPTHYRVVYVDEYHVIMASANGRLIDKTGAPWFALVMAGYEDEPHFLSGWPARPNNNSINVNHSHNNIYGSGNFRKTHSKPKYSCRKVLGKVGAAAAQCAVYVPSKIAKELVNGLGLTGKVKVNNASEELGKFGMLQVAFKLKHFYNGVKKALKNPRPAARLLEFGGIDVDIIPRRPVHRYYPSLEYAKAKGIDTNTSYETALKSGKDYYLQESKEKYNGKPKNYMLVYTNYEAANKASYEGKCVNIVNEGTPYEMVLPTVCKYRDPEENTEDLEDPPIKQIASWPERNDNLTMHLYNDENQVGNYRRVKNGRPHHTLKRKLGFK